MIYLSLQECLMNKNLFRKRTIIGYVFFCMIFALILFVLILVGRRLSPYDTAPSLEETDPIPTVIIDAGHGGEDGGAVGVNGVYEKDINLKIAQYLSELLRANGIPTLMTRTEDVLLYDRNSDYQGHKKVQDQAARKKIAESREPAVFISIHMNAFPDPKYGGLQVYYSENDPTSKLLAEEIQSLSTALLLPHNTRKIKSGSDSVYLLDRLSCPAVLVECGFLSQPEECERLSDENYQKDMALTICLSILNYFSQIYKNPSNGS